MAFCSMTSIQNFKLILSTLNAPTNFVATSSTTNSGTINVSFTASTSLGNVTYKISDGTNITSTALTSLAITGLTSNTSYSYNVVAVSNSGISNSSNTSTALTIPDPPANIVSTPTNNSVIITFSTSNTGIGGETLTYRVYESSVLQQSSTSNSVTISGLVTGSTHSYNVTAVNSRGESTYSSTITTTIIDITTNLHHFFTFENASDTTLINNTGNGNATMSSTSMRVTTSKVGSYAVQNSFKDTVILPSISTVGLSAITICFWYNHQTPPTSTYNMLVRYSDLYISTKSSNIIYISNDSTNAFYTALTVGSWYHVAGIWSTTGMTLYINGVQATTVAGSFLPSTTFPTYNALYMTYNSSGQFDWAYGSIDNYRLYYTALTSTQISYLYNAVL